MPPSKPPLFLGLDTTGEWCSVALVDDIKILALRRQKIGRGHAEILAGMVQDILSAAKVLPADIDKISVCVGPGSFTGLRVGLSFAKGFALPHNIPIVGLSALKIWAAIADPDLDKTVMAIADVRRGQVLSQTFKNGQAMKTPSMSAVSELKNIPEIIVGGGAGLLGTNDASTYICPATLAWLGLEASTTTHPAAPLYHRPTDAKLPTSKNSGGKSLKVAK